MDVELQFGKCILKTFPKDSNLYKEFEGKLNHHPNCPIEGLVTKYNKNELNSIYDSFKDKEIKLACVGLVSDINGKLLLTRRTPKMFSFPKAWVFPGGKVDENENQITTLLREVREETGIDIIETDIDTYYYNDNQVVIKPLMLYESVYPDTLDKGLPSRHVLVLYYYILINTTEIKVTIDNNEIDTYLWIDLETLKHIFEDKDILDLYGFEYNEETGSAHQAIVKSDRLRYWEDRGEGIPYGHYLAFNKLKIN
jgi:8-oxo-dGTP pyrophosphatase MutT (NUDIX family)